MPDSAIIFSELWSSGGTGLVRAIWLLFLFADLIKVPATIAPYSGASNVFSKNGSVRWTADWAMETLQVQGKRAVRITERGSGRMTHQLPS